MAVIRFTPADALQTTLVEGGVYPSEISKIEGPSKSKSGKSLNTFVDLRIVDGKYKGKEITILFNDEMNSASVMGDMSMFPNSYLLVVDGAIKGRKVDAVDYELDTDSLLNQPLDFQWAVQTNEGRLINTIVGFFPSGYGSKAPAF